MIQRRLWKYEVQKIDFHILNMTDLCVIKRNFW